MVRVETPRMSARRRAVIFPRACSSSVIANNRSVFSIFFILAQKYVKRVTDICHIFSVRLKILTRGMEASQSQATRQGRQTGHPQGVAWGSASPTQATRQGWPY